MSTVTVSQGLQHAARLIPFRTRSASNLTGDYGAVLTFPAEMPAQFRAAQEERRAFYLSHDYTEGARCKPDHAVRYYVTSYGTPIAWVTLDGRTHFIHDAAIGATSGPYANDQGSQRRAMIRHRDAVRASWPERFAINGEGDPITMSDGSKYGRVFAPAGSRQTCDRQGYVHIVLPDGACRVCEGAHTDDA